MEGGYIKLYRKFTEWEWYEDPNTKIVFLHLLMTAAWKKTRWHGIDIEPGQVVTTRRDLAEALGLSEQSVRTAIMHLLSTKEITKKSTNKFSVITIENWATYQEFSTGANHQLTNN